MIDQDIFTGNFNYYINQDLIMSRFPKGNEIPFSQGKVKMIDDDNISYTTSTEERSSGAPLIIRKNFKKYYF